ncbi:hypothetical protein QBC44DRAFT_309501 [Cladorrhinum sp. PSN332]|nr:hypothetical protein QBC44DRAFT_309501 [Cladorrhinum sp. PSN332]
MRFPTTAAILIGILTGSLTTAGLLDDNFYTTLTRKDVTPQSQVIKYTDDDTYVGTCPFNSQQSVISSPLEKLYDYTSDILHAITKRCGGHGGGGGHASGGARGGGGGGHASGGARGGGGGGKAISEKSGGMLDRPRGNRRDDQLTKTTQQLKGGGAAVGAHSQSHHGDAGSLKADEVVATFAVGIATGLGLVIGFGLESTVECVHMVWELVTGEEMDLLG